MNLSQRTFVWSETTPKVTTSMTLGKKYLWTHIQAMQISIHDEFKVPESMLSVAWTQTAVSLPSCFAFTMDGHARGAGEVGFRKGRTSFGLDHRGSRCSTPCTCVTRIVNNDRQFQEVLTVWVLQFHTRGNPPPAFIRQAPLFRVKMPGLHVSYTDNSLHYAGSQEP